MDPRDSSLGVDAAQGWEHFDSPTHAVSSPTTTNSLAATGPQQHTAPPTTTSLGSTGPVSVPGGSVGPASVPEGSVDSISAGGSTGWVSFDDVSVGSQSLANTFTGMDINATQPPSTSPLAQAAPSTLPTTHTAPTIHTAPAAAAASIPPPQAGSYAPVPYKTNPFEDLLPNPLQPTTPGQGPPMKRAPDVIVTHSYDPFLQPGIKGGPESTGGPATAAGALPVAVTVSSQQMGTAPSPGPDPLLGSSGYDIGSWVSEVSQPSQSLAAPGLQSADRDTWGGQAPPGPPVLPMGATPSEDAPPAPLVSNNPFAMFFPTWQQPAGANTAFNMGAQQELPPPPSYEDAVDVDASEAGPPETPLPPPPAYDDVMESQRSEPMSNVPAPFASSFPPPGREKCDMQDRICAEVRLPPMYPKDAVWPKRLAAGLDSLYMAPAAAGYAMTQWAHAEKKLSIPEGTATASTEDADAAPSGAVPNPEGLDESITCFLVDERSCSMWTGHKGGAVARWTMSQGKAVKPEPGRWQANGMGDVCCMTLSKSGELWVGSEFGTLRVWSYPGGTPVPRPPVKIHECRRHDSSKPHSKVMHVAASASGRTVWSTGRSSVSLWDAHTLQCMGSMHNADSARKNDIYVLAEREQNWIHVDKGLDPRLAHAPQSSRLFHLDPVYQQQHQQSDADEPSTQRALGTSMMRGINVMGKFAAKVTKAVKQNMAPQLEAAQGDASYTEGKGEDGGSSEKGNPRGLIPIPDGTMVVGFKYGLIEKFTELGRFIGAFDLRTGIKCMSLVAGQWLWVGCRDGHISVLDIVSGKLLRTWPAALFPIISLTAVGSVVYSLSKDGSVKGWPLTQPSEEHAIMWTDGLQKSLHRHDLRVVAGTWNVNCSRPSLHSLQTWLGARCQEADIVVVGLQEVEMGTGSVAQNAAIRVLYSSLLDKGNQNAQWWTMQLDVVLGVDRFVRVALRQMSGILVLVFAHKDLAAHVGEVSSTSVACGVLGLGGNKGAVAVSMSVFRRRMVVLCSHFAAHQDKVEERNADYTKIVRSLHFDNNPAHYHSRNNNQAGEESGNQIVRNPTMVGSTVGQVPSTTSNGNIGQQQTPRSLTHASAAVGPGLLDAEMLAWVGDFNYRIDGQYNFVVDCANHGLLTDLAALDQLRNEMAKGNIFHGLSEGPLAFPPTYKFDKGVETSQEGLLPYDSSEKRRVPAWTDRILWRGSLPSVSRNCADDHLDEDVVVSLHGDNAYNAVVEICESDHKPLVASLQVVLPSYIQNMKRSHSLAVLSSISDSAPSHAQPTPSDAAPPGPPPIKHPTLVFDPATLVAPSTASPPRTPCIVALATPGAPYRLCISPGEQFPLVVSNSGTRTCEAAFAGASNGTQPWLPPWLQITPASFVIEPGSCKQVVFRVLPLEGAPPQRYSFVCELCTQAVADVGKGGWRHAAGGAHPHLLQIDII